MYDFITENITNTSYYISELFSDYCDGINYEKESQKRLMKEVDG